MRDLLNPKNRTYDAVYTINIWSGRDPTLVLHSSQGYIKGCRLNVDYLLLDICGTKYDVQCHMVFNVTKVTFWMTLLMTSLQILS